MQNPATTDHRAKTRTRISTSIVPSNLAPTQYPQARSPQVQHGRSQPRQASQLDLLELLEKSLEPALRIEAVLTDLTVGSSERFCLIHQESGLRVPGQFSRWEAQEVLKVTVLWDWEVDPKTREPACHHYLLCLLEGICKPQKALEVIV